MLSFTPTYSTANNLYWQAGSSTWNTTAANFNTTNTSPGTTAWNNDGQHAAVFAATANSTVTVGSGIMASGIEFDVSGYTLTGGTLTLSAAGAYVQVTNATDTATVNNVLAGANGMIKSGAGTLVLGGANTYTGGTTINGGTLQISSDQNLGDPSGAVTLTGGTLNTTGSITSGRAFGGSGGGIQVASGQTLTLNGVVNIGALTLPGAGTVILANNTFSLGAASNAINGLLTFNTAGATLTNADSSGTVNGQGETTIGGIAASQTSGTVTLAASANVNGTVAATVSSSTATLSITGNLSGSAAIAKAGPGTLALYGDDSGLTGTGTAPASFRQGTAGTTPTSGGTISIGSGNINPNYALGTGIFDANGGKLGNDTGAPVSLPISISLGAQDATTTPGGLVFSGSGANPSITVTGPISLYKGGSVTYEHAITVNVPTTFTGLLTASANTTTSLGLTIEGSSTLTLMGSAPNTLFEPIIIATSGTGSGVIAASPGTFAANASVTLNSGAKLTIGTGQMFSSTEVLEFMAASGAFGNITLNNATGTSAAEVVGGLYLSAANGSLKAGYQPAGYYGGTGSGATYIDPALFSGTGEIYNEGTTMVPEPSSWAEALGGFALLVLARITRRRRA